MTVERSIRAETPADEYTTGSGREEVPLTVAQARFFDRALSDKNHFNHTVLLRADTPIDLRVLRRSIEVLAERHDSLRCLFKGGKAWLAPAGHNNVSFSLDVLDLSTLDEAKAWHRYDEVANAFQRSLDVELGPLWRALVFRMPDGSQRLLLIIHKSICDMTSTAILLRDLRLQYSRLIQGVEPVSSRPLSSCTFAVDAASRAQTWDESEYDAWLKLPWSVLPPFLRMPPAGAERFATTLTTRLTERQTDRFQELGKGGVRVSGGDLVNVGLAEALSDWLTSPLVAFESYGHGRQSMELRNTVGALYTATPCFVEISCPHGHERYTSLLRQVRECASRAPEWSSGKYLDERRHVRASFDSIPPLGVVVNYQGGLLSRTMRSTAPFYVASESPGCGHSPASTRPVNLYIEGGLEDRRLVMTWTSETIASEQTLGQIVGRWQESMESLLSLL